MSNLQGKVWGTTSIILKTPLIEIHKLNIRPNTQCSMHVHERKWNGFYVISGLLDIHVEKNDYDLTDITILGYDDFITVKPGEYHKFVNSTNDEVIALEIYYLDPLAEDIIRKTVGGNIEP